MNKAGCFTKYSLYPKMIVYVSSFGDIKAWWPVVKEL